VAVEQRISADDGWFVGEDKVLRFTVDGDTDGIAGWGLGFRLYAARSKDDDPPRLEILSGGGAIVATEATPTHPAIVTVTVTGEQTQTTGAGQFQFVLSRTDLGARNVLSFGAAAIQSAVRS
jgi:hypothetical protein